MIDCEICETEFEFEFTKEEVEAMKGLNALQQLNMQTLVKCPKCGNQRNLKKTEIIKLFMRGK